VAGIPESAGETEASGRQLQPDGDGQKRTNGEFGRVSSDGKTIAKPGNLSFS
jgi:hypothetical protein